MVFTSVFYETGEFVLVAICPQALVSFCLQTELFKLGFSLRIARYFIFIFSSPWSLEDFSGQLSGWLIDPLLFWLVANGIHEPTSQYTEAKHGNSSD